MKVFTKMTAICLFSVICKAAVAGPMDYEFNLDFTIGDLAGSSTTVTVTLLDVFGTGPETFNVPFGNLLALNFTVDGVSFTLDDRLDLSSAAIWLDDGMIDYLFFESDSNAGEPKIEFVVFGGVGFSYNNLVYEYESLERFSRGGVDVASFGPAASSVPTPTILALFGLGFAGLFVHFRKRIFGV